jgi:hypothetical protein
VSGIIGGWLVFFSFQESLLFASRQVPSVVVSGEERFCLVKNRFIKIRIAPRLPSSQ